MRKTEHPDHIKELMKYLQLWTGLIFVTSISLLGWLIINTDHPLLQLA